MRAFDSSRASATPRWTVGKPGLVSSSVQVIAGFLAWPCQRAPRTTRLTGLEGVDDLGDVACVPALGSAVAVLGLVLAGALERGPVVGRQLPRGAVGQGVIPSWVLIALSVFVVAVAEGAGFESVALDVATVGVFAAVLLFLWTLLPVPLPRW
jgi:hypothetical protein